MSTCEGCGNEIVKAYPGGKTKIRAAIIVVEDGIVKAVCNRCKKETAIPLQPDETAMPKFSHGLYVRR